MKKLNQAGLLTALLLLFAVTATAGTKLSLNSGWMFKKEKDTRWTAVTLPHTWNAGDDMDDTPGYYRGKGLYKRTLHIDEEASGKQVYLFFDGANQETTVSVNGRVAGSHKGGYTRFAIDITPYIKTGADNGLLITVDNSYNKMIPPLSADYTFFGGVYRSVYLVYENKVHISMTDRASSGVYVSTPKVNEQNAEVKLRLLLNNKDTKDRRITWESTLTAPDGTPAGTLKGRTRLKTGTENNSVSATTSIRQPQLWTPDTPQLYSLRTVIRDEKGDILDESVETFGLRWFRFDANEGFFLNGKHLKLIGTNRHQDYLGRGWAIGDAYHINDVRLLKAMGGNYLRVSHYPQDPAVLEECDRLGILASVEIPIVNAVTESQEFLDNSLVMQEEMIKQSFNHPSVIVWAYMNEVLLVPPYKEDDSRYQRYLNEVHRQAQAIENLTRRLDPYRWTMIPFNNYQKPYELARLHDVPMIVGWNIYAGWYSGRFDDLERFLDEYRTKHPDKPTVISEYGADCDPRIHSDTPQRFDYSMEYADLYQEHYLRAIQRLPYIAGANLWNLNDFSSEARGNAVPHVNLKGVVTRDRRPKNTYWLYKAHFSKELFVKIASADWTTRSGRLNDAGQAPEEVKIYSNCTEVEAWLNGKSLGRKTISGGFARFTVPFVNGENQLSASSTDGRHLSDAATIHFNGIADTIGNDFSEMNILLGSNRSFTDPDGRVCWIPAKEYTAGSWGYIGGEPCRPRTWAGLLPASDVPLLGTDLDPLYQTQMKNLTAFKADVPQGRYAVTLIWADLTKETYEKLVYNLGNDAIHEDSENSFGVQVNGKTVFKDLDIRREVGRQTPLEVKVYVDVTPQQPRIDISLTPHKGSTLLNAVRILRVK